MTALHWSCWNGHTESAKLLMKDRACNIGAKDGVSISFISNSLVLLSFKCVSNDYVCIVGVVVTICYITT